MGAWGPGAAPQEGRAVGCHCRASRQGRRETAVKGTSRRARCCRPRGGKRPRVAVRPAQAGAWEPGAPGGSRPGRQPGPGGPAAAFLGGLGPPPPVPSQLPSRAGAAGLSSQPACPPGAGAPEAAGALGEEDSGRGLGSTGWGWICGSPAVRIGVLPGRRGHRQGQASETGPLTADQRPRLRPWLRGNLVRLVKNSRQPSAVVRGAAPGGRRQGTPGCGLHPRGRRAGGGPRERLHARCCLFPPPHPALNTDTNTQLLGAG